MERTDHIGLDALLQRIPSEPSHAADLLTATAEQLEDDYTGLPITLDVFTAAANEASEQILDGMPPEIARPAVERAYQALPPICHGQTVEQYAAQLRAAAWVL